MIPADSAYRAAREQAALIDRSDRARIVVSGADRASYLQGLLTNDVAALKAGEGCYAAYLTAQGRMITDLFVYELGDVMLLVTEGAVKDTLLAKLDQFIFAEDVQLGDVTATFAQIGIVGPASAALLGRLLADAGSATVDAVAALPLHGNLRTTVDGGAVIVTRTADAGEPGFDLFVEHGRGEALRVALTAAGAVVLNEETAEAIRIEAGVPRFRRDMDEETIPLEAGIESQAISFSKGCYVGQEVIIRVLHRGHGRVARRLVGLKLEGSTVPARDTAIQAPDGRDIGQVTSATLSPALGCPIALGYVHRDFVEPGARVTVGGVAAEVVKLPFVDRGASLG